MLSFQKLHSKSFTLKPLVQVNIGHSRSTSVYLETDKQTTGLPGLLLLQLKSLSKTMSGATTEQVPPGSAGLVVLLVTLPHSLAHLPRQPRQQGGAGVRLGLGQGVLSDIFCH